MNKSTRFPLRAAAAAFAIALPALGHAQVFNGDFHNGLSGWSVGGDASADTAQPALRLSTAHTDELAYNVSGAPAIGAGYVGGLEDAVGLPLGALDPAGGFAYEGAFAQQTFNASAGQRLTFQWNLGTRDEAFADQAFVVLNGQLILLGTAADAHQAAGGDMLWQTGEHSFSMMLAAGGPVTLSFGVVDVGDYAGVSALSVRNVEVSAVPEPQSLALLLAGAGLLALRRRKSI